MGSLIIFLMFLLLVARASSLFHITAAHEKMLPVKQAWFMEEYAPRCRGLALRFLATSDPAWL